MIIYSIYDNLSNGQKDFIQSIGNLDLLKRNMLSRYRKMINDKNIQALDEFKDLNIIVYGEIKEGVITLYSKDKMKDISLASFLGIEEVKTNESESN